MLPIGDMICCRQFFAPVLVLGTFAECWAAPIRLVHSPSLLLIGICISMLKGTTVLPQRTSDVIDGKCLSFDRVPETGLTVYRKPLSERYKTKVFNLIIIP